MGATRISKPLLLSIVMALLIGCSGGSSCYDKGYQHGYDGAEKSSGLMCGDKYDEGYWDGQADADCDYWQTNDPAKYKRNC